LPPLLPFVSLNLEEIKEKTRRDRERIPFYIKEKDPYMFTGV